MKKHKGNGKEKLVAMTKALFFIAALTQGLGKKKAENFADEMFEALENGKLKENKGKKEMEKVFKKIIEKYGMKD